MQAEDYNNLQTPDSPYDKNESSPYADKFEAGAGKGVKKPVPKGKQPKNGELTILANFSWKPAITDAQEIKYLLSGKWSPSFVDFQEITGSTDICSGNFITLLGMIEECAPKSIKRLNFWTHSDKKNIGITGHIDPPDVYFDFAVSELELQQNAANNLTYTLNSKSFTLEDVRNRFAEGAIFVLYGCRAGYDPTTLLTALKDLL